MEKLKAIMWDEWAAVHNETGETSSNEIGGVLSGLPSRASGSFLLLYSSRLFVFRRLKRLWHASEWAQCGDFSPNLVIPGDMKGRVSLKVDILPASSLLTRFGRVVRAKLDSWNWLRGVFGSCGSLFIPKTGYYLVFRLPANSREQLETSVTKVLKMNRIPFRSRWRYGLREIVIRDQSAIVGMLSNMRLFRTSLILEEKAMLRSMRDRANKIVNCDSSNIRKTVEAAERQIQIAQRLLENGIILSLPDPLRDVIAARIENPAATLRELGQFLPHPVSKSTIEYRWRKIEQLATKANV
ncbi:MAG: DNA-binding protein WhiA [Thermovirgaceae bacterium]|nr:DNA-binding protein WhiA [Thermovirgaceae bacterium]